MTILTDNRMNRKKIQIKHKCQTNRDLFQYLNAFLYESINCCFSDLSSYQYLLGITKSDGTRHSGHAL